MKKNWWIFVVVFIAANTKNVVKTSIVLRMLIINSLWKFLKQVQTQTQTRSTNSQMPFNNASFNRYVLLFFSIDASSWSTRSDWNWIDWWTPLILSSKLEKCSRKAFHILLHSFTIFLDNSLWYSLTVEFHCVNRDKILLSLNSDEAEYLLRVSADMIIVLNTYIRTKECNRVVQFLIKYSSNV